MGELIQFNHPLSYLFIAGVFSLLPFLLLCFSPFIKFSIVFSLVKSSFGMQQFPSTAVTSLLCLILSIYVMKPTFEQIAINSSAEISQAQAILLETSKKKTPATEKLEVFKNLLTKSSIPLVNYLKDNSSEKEQEIFSKHWNKSDGGDTDKFIIIIPAFISSQLKQGFILGVALYLPMLFIDLLLSNILIALGINMISPTIISLPLKLMLFISCDAWLKLCNSLLGV